MKKYSWWIIVSFVRVMLQSFIKIWCQMLQLLFVINAVNSFCKMNMNLHIWKKGIAHFAKILRKIKEGSMYMGVWLMSIGDELKKINAVVRKLDQSAPHQNLLVLDATTGQNAINQLEVFNQIAEFSPQRRIVPSSLAKIRPFPLGRDDRNRIGQVRPGNCLIT
jgi:hypothetical protein